MYLAKSRGKGVVKIIFRVWRVGVCLFLLVASCSPAKSGASKGKKGNLLIERNSELSMLLSRIVLKEKAGTTNETGQYLVKLFEVPRGEECDVGGSLCEGIDLVISVSSLDLNGDKAVYRVQNLANWDFKAWKTYAEYDSPEYFTSFEVSVESRDGKPLAECERAPSGRTGTILFRVNPWKVTCAYSN
jgi:hypothetical protein